LKIKNKFWIPDIVDRGGQIRNIDTTTSMMAPMVAVESASFRVVILLAPTV